MPSRLSILELRSVRGTGGGPEKTILLGADQRDRARFDVTVCYIRDLRDDVFAIQARASRLDLDYVELTERRAIDPALWRNLKALVRARRIDLVHAHDYKTNLLAWCLARATGVVPLATAHGWTGHSRRERLLYYPADKRLLSRFPRVVAVSTEIREEILRHGGSPDRVTVLLNGIDPHEFRRGPGCRDEVRAALGYYPDDVVIGAVGRLERQKRFDLLLDAFATVSRTRPRLNLAIAGDGSLRTALDRQANQFGIAGRVQWLGHRDDVVRLHHAFDLFVQTSDYEGTPNAVLEAMALETPIVATNAGGTAEVARPTLDAMIVPAGDVLAITRALEAVLEDPDAARQRATSARRRVETELAFEIRTRRLEAIYLELGLARDAARPLPLSSATDA